MTNNHAPPADFTLDIPIFSKLYDFYKNLSQVVATFPKSKRYTLGLRLDNISLDIFELLLSIPLAADKQAKLKTISTKLDVLKVLLRLTKDTKAMSNSDYLTLQTSLQEIGKMLGGWLRYTKNS